MAEGPDLRLDWLQGRVGVVSGGAAGIGAAVARRLSAAGARVFIADIDVPAGQQAAQRLGAGFVAVDLSTLDGVRAMMAAAQRELGTLDLLVNNVGGLLGPVYPQASPEQWIRTLDLNLRGVMLAIQLALPLMPAGGAIVNVASVAGLGYGPHRAPDYAVAKAGLLRLTGCLAALQDSHRIRVNCVCPDLTDTPASRRDRASMTPAQRAAAPPPLPAEDIADAVIVLLTDPTLAGRTIVCRHNQPRRLLLPNSPWPEHLNTLT